MVLDFSEINMTRLSEVGGENASIGEMFNKLSALGIRVPKGFATVSKTYREFLQSNVIDNKIYFALKNVDVNDVLKLKEVSNFIQKLIINAEFSKSFEEEVHKAYLQLNLNPSQTVAVRSSATAEDLPEASFAGQQETYLNVSGIDNVLIAIKRVYASLFTMRAISYRIYHGFDHQQVAISAGVQQMIRSDCGSSGVIFTIDTESGFDQVVFITASYGLGEMVVQGAVNPDEFYVHKPTLKAGKTSIISRKLGTCKKLNKYVGICGQGPSDHPDLATWLMNEGIDSLSLSPDSIIRTWITLGK